MFHVEQISAFIAVPGIIFPAMAQQESAQPSVPTLTFPLSTDNETAKQECQSGLLDLLFGWDESARNHFERAIEADSACIFAHAGNCLVGTRDEKTQAQLKDLVHTSMLLPQEAFLVETILKLAAKDYESSRDELCKRANQYRADKISAVWSIILLHSSDIAYHPETGEPSKFQQEAIKRALQLCQAYPEDALVSFTRAYIEQTAPQISSDALASAAHAADAFADHPMPQQLMGHLLSRIGQYEEAASYFNKAAVLSSQRGLSLQDSELWWKARLCETTALWAAGKIEESAKLQKTLNRVPAKEEVYLSPVGILQRWECSTLPLRLLVAAPTHPTQNSIAAASAVATPKPAWKTADYVLLVRDCLRATLHARLKHHQGKIKEAQHSLSLAEKAFEQFENSFEAVTENNRHLFTPWYRMREACIIAINLAKAALYQSTSETWLKNASEAHQIPQLLLPPVIPTRSNQH